ncbi:hypothetical protein MSP8887_01645 [Marinomonas spartinae]|uniref:Uncharacterized protein n=1 Tax=Marinomonas spartinae TaxID=1792290 RepID=A0A1A8TGP2_9GAMM|nr:hypothetical protein [Marinomonas spartinae]SBS31431.1 hypothetical protein MSP8886_02116 [Marinomonas spartinae]SBS32117.1 hypothetical protein MSP8887_01645 [Marinomonas spartinae]
MVFLSMAGELHLIEIIGKKKFVTAPKQERKKRAVTRFTPKSLAINIPLVMDIIIWSFEAANEQSSK